MTKVQGVANGTGTCPCQHVDDDDVNVVDVSETIKKYFECHELCNKQYKHHTAHPIFDNIGTVQPEPASSHLFFLTLPSNILCGFFRRIAGTFSMVIERAVALWKRQQYESYGPKLGIISAIASIAVSFSSTAWAAQHENFTPQTFYCSSSSEKTAYRLMFRKSFSQQSYQLRENANVIPFYTTISPILMWLIIRWSKKMKTMKVKRIRMKTKSEEDAYFLELKRVWNTVPPIK
ncbi:hypothetical protein TELCIR_02229 [Teladorsagia circumcincta]|uniref:Uncharacterized protein n=1 Tax=Teladorsagia circumcincta TaxID=45464 RepID=A0A2G9UZQ4_TELCI|nr:hypothetical protein TELCIR_02229 [Teladorsagia circumcincta]